MTVDDICSFEIENDEFERKSEKIDTDNIIETKHCEISENTVMEMERVNLKEEKKFEEGGYGWLICVGAFIIYIIIGGVMRCYSLIFDALLDKFQHSNAKTAWVGAIHSSLKLLTGPLAGALQGYLSPRQMIFIGCSLWSLGLVLTGLSTSLELCIAAFGILSGMGANFLLVTTLFIIPQYFNKKKGKAMGLVFCGVSIGMVTFAYLFPVLYDNYGFSGTFLVLSGVSMHAFISAMLYKLPDNTQFKKNKSNQIDKISDKTKFMDKFIKGFKSKLSLFSNKSFCFCCFVFSSLFMAFNMINTFTAGLLKEREFASEDVSLLFLLSGIMDVFARPFFGAVIDIKSLRKRRYIVYTAMSCFGGFGICSVALFAHSRILLFCLIPIATAIIGSCASQISTIISDLVGLNDLGDAIGYVRFTQGLGVLFSPTIGGWLKDVTNTYTYNFIISATFLIIPTICFAIFMHLQDLKKAKKEKEENQVYSVA